MKEKRKPLLSQIVISKNNLLSSHFATAKAKEYYE